MSVTLIAKKEKTIVSFSNLRLVGTLKCQPFFLKSIDNLFIELYNDNTSLFVCMIVHGHSPIWKRDYMCLG